MLLVWYIVMLMFVLFVCPYEAKQIAGMSLEKYGPKHPDSCLDFVSTALPELDNWSVCDILAMSGITPIVYSRPELVLPLSEKWIQHTDKWIRRFGVVTLLGYKKVKTKDHVFRILGNVMEDEEKDVKKAVAWILREITKGNPAEVAEFLTMWANTKPSSDTRWTIKQGMTKLPEGDQETLLSLLDRTNDTNP